MFLIFVTASALVVRKPASPAPSFSIHINCSAISAQKTPESYRLVQAAPFESLLAQH